MIDKQRLLSELLREKRANIKIGIIIKGIDKISPEAIVKELAKDGEYIYAAAIGYDNVGTYECEDYIITDSIEKAVLWRSMPECSKKILVFIKSDSDKLHSLAELETVSIGDFSRYLIAKEIRKDKNTPTNNFWQALYESSGYYSYEDLDEFIGSVNSSPNPEASIPDSMWLLNLLKDPNILSTKSNPAERLQRNRDLIFAIGQMSEDSRQKLSRSMVRIKGADKERLQLAYRNLQSFYKYGDKQILKHLDINTVQELFSASKRSSNKKKKKDDPNKTGLEDAPIRPKELNQLISDAIVFGDDEKQENIQELFRELEKHYDTETDENNESIPTIGGIFSDRTIVLDTNQSNLRKLVEKFCNSTAWGGLMETDETVLKDAIFADAKSVNLFSPDEEESLTSFVGGIDGKQTLFNFITQFDAQFDAKGIETAEHFEPIVSELKNTREQLLAKLDMLMYYPALLFGTDESSRRLLIDYIDAWERMYHAFSVNEPTMRQLSAVGTSFIAKALLLLDVLYVKTPHEWKAILMPMHPVFLWRYYEVFKTFAAKKSDMSEEDKNALANVLTQLPQVLSFVIANGIVTDSSDDKALPCSGNIEMLPTFENKTNRYLGNDGTEAVSEILTRWIGFAPFTRNEIRICSVDAPDLVGIIRQIKAFMDKNSCRRVVYDVYLTRGQNGNNELSKLDYSGIDHEIGEYIKEDRIAISIRNMSSAHDVNTALDYRPVHVAFYFDQSSYVIEFGPNSKNLYINPLVITYKFEYDEIQHRGRLFPSSEMDSGLIGDYHKLLKSADVVSNSKNPRAVYNANADMTAVVSTIQDEKTQWLVVADRDTNNYQPADAIPIGEMQYEKRVVNVWASAKSRIITQYLTMLRAYNLYPKAETLIDILRKFGHIASNGLISIPKSGADMQAIDNKKKGLLGTLFAAAWYTNRNKDSLVATLDDDRARLWLHNNKYGNERADLIGLYYEEDINILHVQPIEVKTRDESPDAIISRDEADQKKWNITGHAADQIASVVEMLRDIFLTDEATADMFTAARREVLKYQIVSECFRNIHDSDWQKSWSEVLKKAFGHNKAMKIDISGILLHIKLNEATGSEHSKCRNPEFDDCVIDYWKLTAKEIQRDVLGDTADFKEIQTPDFDNSENAETQAKEDAIIDRDFEPENDKDKCPWEDYKYGTNSSMNPIKKVADEPADTGFQKNANEVKKDKGTLSRGVSEEEIQQLVKDFKRACGDYRVNLSECNSEDTVVGPSVIRLKFKLGRGQKLQGLASHLEDIGREMKRTGVIIQKVSNSDALLLDVPRYNRDKVLFRDVVSKLPKVSSPEQLYFPLGRTPNGVDLIEDLGQMPHMLVGGSTGSGKSVFLFTLLASLIMSHPKKEDMQLILSSSKLEDFIHFDRLPHLYSGNIISDASEAARVIKEVIFEESERRGRLLADARVANITEYNRVAENKLEPIVVVIDEFADLADQLDTKKEKDAFYKPVQRIAQAGRSRGIHLIICTQRPEAKLVPSTTKAQLNGRVALRVNDGISSRMIIETGDAQYLQKHGDLIYKNGDVVERAQGYLIEIPELDQIVEDVIAGKYNG